MHVTASCPRSSSRGSVLAPLKLHNDRSGANMGVSAFCGLPSVFFPLILPFDGNGADVAYGSRLRTRSTTASRLPHPENLIIASPIATVEQRTHVFFFPVAFVFPFSFGRLRLASSMTSCKKTTVGVSRLPCYALRMPGCQLGRFASNVCSPNKPIGSRHASSPTTRAKKTAKSHLKLDAK